MSVDTGVVLVAGYQDLDAAHHEFDHAGGWFEARRITIEGAIQVSNDADTQAALGALGGHLGRQAPAGVSALHSQSGCSPPGAGVAGAGAVVSEFADHRVEAGLEQIVCDLHEQFPDASIEEIRFLVAGIWDHFANAKIRDFLPVLVRRQAKEELRDHLERGAAKGLPIGDGSHG